MPFSSSFEICFQNLSIISLPVGEPNHTSPNWNVPCTKQWQWRYLHEEGLLIWLFFSTSICCSQSNVSKSSTPHAPSDWNVYLHLPRIFKPTVGWTNPLKNMRTSNWIISPNRGENKKYLVIQSDLFGMVKWPFQGLSDLQLGDKKGTLNHLVVNIPVPWSILEPHSTTIGDFFKPKTQTAWSPDRERSLRTEPWSTSQPPTFESSGQKPRKPKVYTFFSFYACNLEFWSLHFPNSQKAQRFSSFGFSWTSRKSPGHKKKRFLRTLKWRKSGLLHLFPWTRPLLFQPPVCFVEICPSFGCFPPSSKNPCMV